MRLTITRRLILYFTVVLLVFAIVMGGLFGSIFSHQSRREMTNNLERRVTLMARSLSGYAEQGSLSTDVLLSLPNNGGYGKRKHGAGAYLRDVNHIARGQVWIVRADDHVILTGAEEPTVSFEDLPAPAVTLIDEILAGTTTSGTDFGDLLGAPSLSVGAPILDSTGNPVAAVLLHTRLAQADAGRLAGLRLLVISSLTALCIGLAAAVLLSRRFTQPLKQMEQTTVALSGRDYTARTGVTLSDEIGSLAWNIDNLAGELEKAEAESSQLEQMRRDYIANISHELRTPVTVLRGSLEALRDGVVSEPEQVVAYHEEMLRESMHLERMVNDLLELSRLQNPDYAIETAPINLMDALGDAVRSLRQVSFKRQITVILQDNYPKPCPIEGDYGRLRQMFTVVLDNAVKFSPEGGTVTVTVTRGSTVHIEIEDCGSGIPPADLPHIFERFYKTSDERNSSGTGLGLAIAKQIADRHGISLTASSAPGGGALFTFIYPCPLM